MTLPSGLKRGRWDELGEDAVRSLLKVSGLEKTATDKAPQKTFSANGNRQPNRAPRNVNPFDAPPSRGFESPSRGGFGNDRPERSNNQQSRSPKDARDAGKKRPRQPDPLQTALGFPSADQSRRGGTARGSGQAIGQGIAARRRSRGA